MPNVENTPLGMPILFAFSLQNVRKDVRDGYR